MTAPQQTVLLGVTASVAAYRACDLILDLKEKGFKVQPVPTRDAGNFVTPLLLQSLSGEEVVTDFFSVPGRIKPIHIELARAADLIVIAPASADVLAKMRAGIADELLLCVLLAATCPVIVAPAMNDHMYEHPATRENLKVLKDRGVRVLEPVEGRLVCTDWAKGHIVSNDKIIEAVCEALKGKPLS